MGGLGNQMFQYALGRQLAYIHKTTLKLDTFDLLDRHPRRKNHIYRNYDLSTFNIKAEFATKAEVKRFTVPRTNNKYIYYLKNLIRRHHNIVKQRHFHFDESILSVPDWSYLEGMWQSEKYFSNVESIIREDFSLDFALSSEAVKMADKIESSMSICLHLRRGDFVANPVHGTCSLRYYYRAIEYIANKVKDPHFYIFSDDIKWCKENLQINHPSTLMMHDFAGEKFKYDLKLMISCKHLIISNSTFGWWAAWLNPNPDKILIAPKQWFQNPEVDTSDLIPEAWIRL